MIARKIITILVIFSLTMPMFVPVVQAGVLGTGITFTSCATAGFLSGLVQRGIDKLKSWITSHLGDWFRSQITGNVLGLGRVPVYDKDVRREISDLKGAYTSKEGVQDVIARCAAREILTAMGRNITNVARTTGRNGGPAWVRNWRNFQLDAQYRGEGIFRGILASSKPCNYFGNDLKDLFGAKEKVDLTKIRTRTNSFDSFPSQVGCTLPNDFDVKKYQSNFSGNGGWEAWSRLLEPQNNFYGTFFKSLDEAAKQRTVEQSADINEAGPTGFTSSRGGKSLNNNCAVKSKDGRCLIYKDILTPAGILSGAVVSGIEAELQWVATSDELNEVIASAVNILLNRLIDLSNSNEGNYEVPGDPTVSTTPYPTPIEGDEGGGGDGGGGVCRDQGGNPDYAGNLQSALNTVISTNPNGIADKPYTTENGKEFLGYVANELGSGGFNATTDVLNGNDKPNPSGDLIGIWKSGDPKAERYDALVSGKPSIRESATSGQFTGDIPLSCVGGGGTPTPTPTETPTP